MTKKNNLYLTKHIKSVVKKVEKKDQEKKDLRKMIACGSADKPLDTWDLVKFANLCRRGLSKI